MSKKPVAVHRVTFNEDEIAAVVYELRLASGTKQLDPAAQIALNKLHILAMKVNIGLAKPAYINTGRQESSISIDKLSEMDTAPNNDMFHRGNAGQKIQTYTPDEQFDAEIAAAEWALMPENLTKPPRHWKEFLSKEVLQGNIREVNESNTSCDLVELDSNADALKDMFGKL